MLWKTAHVLVFTQDLNILAYEKQINKKGTEGKESHLLRRGVQYNIEMIYIRPTFIELERKYI